MRDFHEDAPAGVPRDAMGEVSRVLDQLQNAASSVKKSGSSLHIEFGGVQLNVTFGNEEVRQELERRTGYHYSIQDVSPAPNDHSDAYSIVVTSTRVTLDRLFEQCYSGQVSIQRHHRMQRYTRSAMMVQLSDGRLLSTEPASATIFTQPSTRSAIVSHPDPVVLAKECRRLIRDIVNADLLAGGAIELHAAGVALPGRQVIAFAGDSNSGKTTLALGLVRAGRASLVCNGRLFVAADDDLRALGPPEHILVRQGTLAGWPEFSHLLPSAAQDQLKHGVSRWQLDDGDKVSLQLRDIAETWRCAFSSQGPLRAIVLCDLRSASLDENSGLKQLSGSAAKKGIQHNVVDETGWSRRLWHGLVEKPSPTIPGQRTRLAERIASEVPIFSLTRSPAQALDIERVLSAVGR